MQGGPPIPQNFIHPTFRAADQSMLITNYMQKYPYEQLDNIDNSYYYDPLDGDRFSNCSAHQVALRFLKQVRESGGYDVDCYPPTVLGSPFNSVNLYAVHEDEYEMARYMKLVNFAMNVALPKINSDTGRDYIFVRLVKAVTTRIAVALLTFTAKQSWNGEEHTFRAMVADPIRHKEAKVLEWRFKPVDALTAAADVDGWYMWNGHHFVLVPLYVWNGHAYVLYRSPTTYMWNGHDYVLCSSSTS